MLLSCDRAPCSSTNKPVTVRRFWCQLQEMDMSARGENGSPYGPRGGAWLQNEIKRRVVCAAAACVSIPLRTPLLFSACCWPVGGVGRSGPVPYSFALPLRVALLPKKEEEASIKRLSRPVRASKESRQATSRARDAARERSASKRTREMVTSTPGILLLPVLICLQHFVNVHGKCRDPPVCVRVRASGRSCVFCACAENNRGSVLGFHYRAVVTPVFAAP